jgi:hypothetical protein
MNSNLHITCPEHKQPRLRIGAEDEADSYAGLTLIRELPSLCESFPRLLRRGLKKFIHGIRIIFKIYLENIF